MIIDERYNDNVIFNKVGLQQLLDNIKNYPIINAEYLSSGEALTQNSPCIRITFGDSESELGFLSYALNFQSDSEYSQANYDALLKDKQNKENSLANVNKELNYVNKIYNELVSLYNQKVQEIEIYKSSITETNISDYDKMLAKMAAVFTNYFNYIDLNVDGFMDNEAVHFTSENNIYDYTLVNVPTEQILKNIELYLNDEEQNILSSFGSIRVFNDYTSFLNSIDYIEIRLANSLYNLIKISGLNDNTTNNNIKQVFLKINYEINNFDSSSSIARIRNYIYSGVDTNEDETKNALISSSDFTELQNLVSEQVYGYITAIIAFRELNLTIINYYQKWVNKETDSVDNLHAQVQFLHNYIVKQLGKAYIYINQDGKSYQSNKIYYTYDGTNYQAIEGLTAEAFNVNKSNYYLKEEQLNGEMYTKIQQANNRLQTLKTNAADLNNEIIVIENSLNDYLDWAQQQINSLSIEDKEKLLGHAYLPVGSNIIFKDSLGNDINELTPIGPQPTGTFRVSINDKMYEVPIKGLAGGEENITLSGNIIPSEDNNFDIGAIEQYILATKYDATQVYYIKNENTYTEADPQPTSIDSENETYYIKVPNRRWQDLYLSNSLQVSGAGDGVAGTDSAGEIPETWTAAPNNQLASIYTTGGICAVKNIYGKRVFNAVFNDYAECRKTIDLEPGRVVIDQDDGSLACASARLQPGAQVISDTYGHLMGADKGVTTPIAVAGRVLAYPFEDKNKFHAGMAVCSAPDGTVDIMTREEIREYPDCIVGIVSEIPKYEIWGSGNVKVNGRIWIKVK